MTKKYLSIIIIIIFISMNVSGIKIESNLELIIKYSIKSSYGLNHTPIYINCNADFTPENGVTGGSGTENDPFIIENWHIIGDGIADYGIKINNTDAFFVVKNCTFDVSIIRCVYILNAENGFVEDIETFGNFVGIAIWYCINTRLSNCTIRNNINTGAFGIECGWSSNITIIDSETSNKEHGIYIWDVSNIKIENTTSNGNIWDGIDIYGDNIRDISIKNCTVSNNGADGICIRSDIMHYGNVRVSNCVVFDNGVPPPNVHINSFGINVYHLEGTIVKNCTVYHNGNGIYLGFCYNSVIRNCTVYDHLHNCSIPHAGIMVGPSYITIMNCDIYSNGIGISGGGAGLFLTGISKDISIQKNNIYSNFYDGIFIGFFTLPIQINYNNIYNNNLANFSYTGGLNMLYFCIAYARNNWWGSENGPKTPLHQSEGDAVVRFISWAFIRPWLKEPVPDAGIIS